MKRALLALALVGLCLIPRADAQDDDSPITLSHEQAAKLLQRYRNALENEAKAEEEAYRLKQRMDICWAGYGGFKN